MKRIVFVAVALSVLVSCGTVGASRSVASGDVSADAQGQGTKEVAAVSPLVGKWALRSWQFSGTTRMYEGDGNYLLFGGDMTGEAVGSCLDKFYGDFRFEWSEAVKKGGKRSLTLKSEYAKKLTVSFKIEGDLLEIKQTVIVPSIPPIPLSCRTTYEKISE